MKLFFKIGAVTLTCLLLSGCGLTNFVTDYILSDIDSSNYGSLSEDDGESIGDIKQNIIDQIETKEDEDQQSGGEGESGTNSNNDVHTYSSEVTDKQTGETTGSDLTEDTSSAVTSTEVGGYTFVSVSVSASVTTPVNVRSGPGTTYSTIGSFEKGASVTVTGVSATAKWYQVNFNGQTGYCYYMYLTLSDTEMTSEVTEQTEQQYTLPITDPAVETTNLPAHVISAVNIRSGPGTSYGTLGYYPAGQAIVVTGISGRWYQVSYNGQTGYCYKDYIALD